ncbi:MAG: gliding motility-associated C-terminal domain-containing protein, partial [Bacteroidota bacterium]
VITALPIACNGDSTDLHASVSGGGTPPYTYEWNTGFTGQDLLDVYAGTYWVVATDDHDCKDTAWITLTNPPVLAMDTITHALACAQACNGSISVTMTGGVSPYYYNWSNGGFMPGIHDLCSGYYTVTLSDALGCSFTVDFFIGISDYVPPLDATADDYYIYVGQGTQLHATDTDAYYYIWKPPGLLNSSNIANPYATPEQTTSFEVMVIDNFGCTNIDTVTIFVSEVICDEPFIYVPNAFTPNGDGQNDILYVESNVVDELYFAVYDRWGEIMFETTDISKGWDGKYHGELVDPAVFVYYMKAVCLDKMTFIKKGNITVIR